MTRASRLSQAPASVHSLVEGTAGWLSRAEADLLYTLARACQGRGVIVEIGSFAGKSTTFLAAGSDAGAKVPVVAVDPHVRVSTGENRFPRFERQVQRSGLGHLIRPIVATSAVAAAGFAEPVELLFIDGDHSEAAVRLDWELWFPKLIEGGIVALHDTIRCAGPEKVADDLLLGTSRCIDPGLVDSITFGRKAGVDAGRSRLQVLRVSTLHRACVLAARMSVPESVKTWGGALIRRLQA